MRVRITYNVTVSNEYRRALRHYRGEEGLATRDEVKSWFAFNGETMNGELEYKHAGCCWHGKPIDIRDGK